MKPTPEGWPRLSSAVYYEDAAAAIDWLSEAFGFEVRVKVAGDDGDIEHSQLTYGEGLIMVGSTAKRSGRGSPRRLDGANTQSLCLFVDDADAHCERARATGATISAEPETYDYGEDYWADRTYEATDPEGHRWYFMQRLREATGGHSG